MIPFHLMLLILVDLLGFIIVIPLIIAIGGGLLLGSLLALRDLKELFVEAHTLEKPQGQKEQEPVIGAPAGTMYPLGPGWRVLRYMARNLMARSRESAARWIDRAASLRYLGKVSSWMNKWTMRPLIIGFYVAAGLQYLPHILLALLIIALYSSLLLAWLCIALVTIGVFSISHLIYKAVGHQGYHCPACYKHISAPIYLCPTCQAEHPQLHPGISGVFAHRCNICATYLPTQDLFGRRRLLRFCPDCHCILSSDLGTGPAIHISLVGGSATGKTSYLIAACQALKQRTSRTLRVAFADTIQEQAFEKDLCSIQEQHSLASASVVNPCAWVLKLRFSRKLLPRLLYLYDPPGEVFRGNAHTALQGYYASLNGILFIIDAQALSISQRHDEQVKVGENIPSPVVGNMEVMQVYAHMMQMFEVFAGLSTRKRYRQPVAVVVTRTDALRLDPQSPIVVGHLSTKKDFFSFARGVHHSSLRELLCTCGLDNFVRDLEAHFAHIQYFACSALEDLNDLPAPIATEQLLQPLLWLLDNTI